MRTTTDKPASRIHLESHNRNRSYALTGEEAERENEILWYVCSQNEQTYHWVIEELSDRYGLNILRRPRRPEWQPPPQRKDPVSGKLLPNPWETGNDADQRSIKLDDPELAYDLEQRAKNPYQYQLRREAEERKREAWNNANESYTAQTHKTNPFCSGDRAALKEFFEAAEADEAPERVEIYQREAKPVEIELFAPTTADPATGIISRAKNREVWIQAGHDNNKKLLRILLAGAQRRKEMLKDEAERAEAQRAEDVQTLQRQRAAHDDVMRGIRHLPDGRVITMPGR